MQTSFTATIQPNAFGNKYDLVSTFAYLIGVSERIFRSETEPPEPELFRSLETNKKARIIRNLCRIRTDCLKNYDAIDHQAKTSFTHITAMTKYVPQDAVASLCADGIDITNANSAKKKTSRQRHQAPDVTEFIITLNRQITDRLNNIRELFLIWLNWDYIKDLFIMGTDVADVRVEKRTYLDNMRFYPYQCYIHWTPSDNGNFLRNDNRFVQTIYGFHDDQFGESSRVTTVNESVKGDIYEFINESQKIDLIVDCENCPSRMMEISALISVQKNNQERKVFQYGKSASRSHL